ncbi:MAG: extracellular solute-binding protein [Christensenellales bacterium]
MKMRVVSFLLVFGLLLIGCPAIAEEAPVEIHWFCIDNSSGSVSLNADMPVWKQLAERNNLVINIEAVSGADLGQKFNLYLSSGDMPDVMQAPNMDIVNQYGMQGAFVALDEHLDTMSNVQAYLNSDEQLKKALTASDGHVYAISEYRPFPNTEPNPLIRQDWLDNLDLEMPTTIDEWYHVLKAFKEQDANGNGDPDDEIPFSGFFGGLSKFKGLLRGFGIIYDFYPDENGQYQYWYISDEMREAITWLHKLYNEGLIDADIASNDQTLFDQKFDNNTVGVFDGYFFTSVINKNALGATLLPGIKLIGAPPIQMADGGYAVSTSLVALCYYTINAASDKINECLKLFDYIWSEEGMLLTTMGIEGETWITDGDKGPVYTDVILNNPEGMSGTNALRSYGGLNGMPYIHSPMYRIGLYPEELREMAQNTYDTYAAVAKYNPISLAFTEDETAVNATYLGDINTFVNEMLLKFIYGQEALDGWDAFVDNVKAMQLNTVLANYQAAYERK